MVYKDKKRNTWFFRVYISDHYGNKKQKCRSGFITKGLAKTEEQKFLSDYTSEECLDMSFGELYEVFITHKKQVLKPKSFSSNENVFKNHILPYFRDYKLKKIDNKAYINWKAEILKKGYSYKYNSSMHVCMVSILNYAINFYGLEKNIASKVGNFPRNDYIPEVDFWTYEEFKQFISVVAEKEYHALFTTLYYSGMRLGECLALTWNDYNNDSVNVYKTLSRGGKNENYIITSPKTKSSIRRIPLDKTTIDILNKLKKYYKTFVGFTNEWFIFGGLNALTRTTIARKKADYCRLAKVKKIKMHDFRHSHATLLLSRGSPITVISRRLGHKDISMTLNVYSHLIPEDEDKAINIINELNNKN